MRKNHAEQQAKEEEEAAHHLDELNEQDDGPDWDDSEWPSRESPIKTSREHATYFSRENVPQF